MIHRDLAARNVLVTEENICKVHIAVLYVLQGTPSNINVLQGTPSNITLLLGTPSNINVLQGTPSNITCFCNTVLMSPFQTEKNSSVLVCINMLCVYFGVRRQ